MNTELIQENIKEQRKHIKINSPSGIRTRVFAVRGQCPRPLDDGTKKTGRLGFEPRLTESESAVLPLDDLPVN